ncbi:MAG: hypothetical protein QG657_5074 [Acidobacteriota bacterium]|nr:hypothetical protein [Acidobacteriota bacterium]
MNTGYSFVILFHSTPTAPITPMTPLTLLPRPHKSYCTMGG